VGCDDLWTEHTSWCESENRHPGTRAVFGRDLLAAVPTIRHIRGRHEGERRYEYVGIGIKDWANSTPDPGPTRPSVDPGPGALGSEPLIFQCEDTDPAMADGRF